MLPKVCAQLLLSHLPTFIEFYICIQMFNIAIVGVDAISDRLDIRADVGARRCHIYWRTLPLTAAAVHFTVSAAVYRRLH